MMPIPSFPIREPYFKRPLDGHIFLGGLVYETMEQTTQYVDLYAIVREDPQNPDLVVQYGHGKDAFYALSYEGICNSSLDDSKRQAGNSPYYWAVLQAWNRWKIRQGYMKNLGPAVQDAKYRILTGHTIHVIQTLYEDYTGHRHASVLSFPLATKPPQWIVVIGREHEPQHIWSGKEDSEKEGVSHLLSTLIARVEHKRSLIESHLYGAKSHQEKRKLEYTHEEPRDR